MSNFIWRFFIILVIFLAGLLIGNIFAPKQILQEKDIVAIGEVKTSLDLSAEEDFAALAQSPDINEVYIAFLRERYQSVKKEYEYCLKNITKNPSSRKDFVKIQKNYLSLVNYIEQNYPPKQEELIPVQTEELENSSEQKEKQEISIKQPELPQETDSPQTETK